MHTDPKCQPRLLTRARQLALPVDPAASRSINYEPRWPGVAPGSFLEGAGKVAQESSFS